MGSRRDGGRVYLTAGLHPHRKSRFRISPCWPFPRRCAMGRPFGFAPRGRGALRRSRIRGIWSTVTWKPDVSSPAGSAAKERPFLVDIELTESFTARSLTLHPHDGDFFVQCHLQVPDDAGDWRTVRRFPLDRRGLARPQYAVNVGPMIKGPAVVAFAPVTSRRFRLEITGLQGAGGLAEINLSGAARLDGVVEKQLGKMHATPLPQWDSYHWPPSPEPDSRDLMVSQSAVRDLSDELGPGWYAGMGRARGRMDHPAFGNDSNRRGQPSHNRGRTWPRM
jgi:hypothetical protein